MNTVHGPTLPPIAGRRWAVLGMGETGVSCARFLAARGARVRCVDNAPEPPARSRLATELPQLDWACGPLGQSALVDVDAIVASPGVALEQPALQAASAGGIPLLGDIQLFAGATRKPVLGVTGSNGKSTVTTLVWRILEAAGHSVRAGGNLGPPALDLLTPPEPSCFVLELSSFQLELTQSLGLAAACILNLSADHLDRHGTMEAYRAAKARILQKAGAIVLNADDPLVASLAPTGVPVRWVGREAEYCVTVHAGERWLSRGQSRLMKTSELQIAGLHNEFNALAAIALTDCLGVPVTAQRTALQAFDGLPHRCRLIADHQGVAWFDDSKGTNIGATVAAIEGLLADRQGVLIAGGQGKGADFRELRAAVAGRVHTVLLMGQDAPLLEAALTDLAHCVRVADMPEAVRAASRAARPGDAVLLSPACASLDMFDNYAHRGRVFTTAVHELLRA